MPARTEGSATAVAPASTKRFELPALDFNFSSLTDGTDIPPPLPSPVQEQPPKETDGAAPKEGEEEAVSNGTSSSSKMNGAQSKADGKNPATNTLPTSIHPGTKGPLKRTADDIPASPTLSVGRPGSIRRLFSRNLLSTAYANAESQGHLHSPDTGAGSILRPESRSNGSFMDERKLRRSSGWFRRLRGANSSSTALSSGSINGDSPASKRASVVPEEAKKPAGPPPPMIPELDELKAKVDLNDEGSLGSDLFKNIK